MKKVEIKGYGISLPEKTVNFGEKIRYRISGEETHLKLAVEAAQKAIKKSGLTINDIDCIIGACAVGVQPIPCTAALIHEQLAKGSDIPALDINTTCTSFITALDMTSFLIDVKKYERILIVSSDVPSQALNPEDKESYELFSDGAAAIIVEYTENGAGIIDGMQKTWSEGVHSTEIRGGLSAYHPKHYSEKTKEEFMFDMNGKEVLKLSKNRIPEMFEEFLKKNNMKISDIDMVIPHQASLAMPLIMEKLGIEKERYIDLVETHGNMVSASVPVTLCTAMETGKVKKGDTVLLIGTAAGLTTNLMLMKI